MYTGCLDLYFFTCSGLAYCFLVFKSMKKALTFVLGRRVLYSRLAGNKGSFSLGKVFSFSSSLHRSNNNKDSNNGPQCAMLQLGDNDEGQPEFVVIPL